MSLELKDYTILQITSETISNKKINFDNHLILFIVLLLYERLALLTLVN